VTTTGTSPLLAVAIPAGVFGGFLLIVAFLGLGKTLARLAGLVAAAPWRSAVWRARRARKARWRQHYIELLGYGFDESDAKWRADRRMMDEARRAENLLS